MNKTWSFLLTDEEKYAGLCNIINNIVLLVKAEPEKHKERALDMLETSISFLIPKSSSLMGWDWKNELQSDYVCSIILLAFRIVCETNTKVPKKMIPLIDRVCREFFDLHGWENLTSSSKKQFINQLNTYARACVLSDVPGSTQRLQSLFCQLGQLPKNCEWPISECVLSVINNAQVIRQWIDPSSL
eukprot:UN25342